MSMPNNYNQHLMKPSDINPLLTSARLPGTKFRMPTRGIFYTPGVEISETVVDGEVEVFPMTTRDEIALATPDKLLDGSAITDIVARCVPSVLLPNKLTSIDIDYLMMCLRLTTFGSITKVDHKHDCPYAKTHQYEVNIDELIKNTKEIDPIEVASKYSMTLPDGTVVLLRPVIFEDVIRVNNLTMNINESKITEQEVSQLLLTTTALAIKSVNGHENQKHIHEWLSQLHAQWKKEIEVRLRELAEWTVKYDHITHCKDCGNEVTLLVSGNPVSFFS